MSKFQSIPIGSIEHSPFNPRRRPDADDPKVKELADSIKAVGLIQPISVRPCGMDGKKKGWVKFQIIAGARRFEACKLAGMDEINAMVHDIGVDEALKLTITENLQRQDLTPLEEGLGIAELLKSGRSTKEISADIAKSETWVRRRAKLADLSAKWHQVMSGTLAELGDTMNKALTIRNAMTAAHLEIVAQFEKGTQDKILKKIMANPSNVEQGIRMFRYTVQNFMGYLHHLPFDLASEDYGPACSNCLTRSDREADLFNDGPAHEDDARCLNVDCMKMKQETFVRLTVEAAKTKTKAETVLTLSDNYSSKADLQSYQIKEVKKTEKGAVPAVFVTGPKAGKVMYVIPPKPKAERQETPKVATVEQNRLKHILEAIIKWIEERAECPPCFKDDPKAMLKAACFYGMNNACLDNPDTIHHDEHQLFTMAWNCLADPMVSTLSPYGGAERLDVKHTRKDINVILEFLELELSDFEAEAEKAFPDTAKSTTKKGAKK